MSKDYKMVLRNTENDRMFEYNSALAREPWMEVLHVPEEWEMPEVMSAAERNDMALQTINKDNLYLDEYEKMHWTKLKKKLEILGMRWPGDVTTAIAMLRKHGGDEMSDA